MKLFAVEMESPFMVDSKDSTVGLSTSRIDLAGRLLMSLVRCPYPLDHRRSIDLQQRALVLVVSSQSRTIAKGKP